MVVQPWPALQIRYQSKRLAGVESFPTATVEYYNYLRSWYMRRITDPALLELKTELAIYSL